MFNNQSTIWNYHNLYKDIVSPIDYFIVGSHIVLTSINPYDQVTGFPFQLAVFDPSIHQPRPDLVLDAATNGDNTLRISTDIRLFERNLLIEEIIEALEIFIKVCVRRGARAMPFELSLPGASDRLRTTIQEWGFSSHKDELFTKVIMPDTLNPHSRFNDMEQIYQHPLDIPWNFVPLDYDAYIPLLHREERGRILDLGTGFGRNAIPLERHGFEVYGIDISPTAIERCHQLVKKPANYMVASATSLPFPSDYFDFVLDIGCLHCMASEQRIRAVGEICRVLKSGGLLYSRIFKPRSQEWLNVLPFYTSGLGLSIDEVLALFADHFIALIWKEHMEMNYIIAQKVEGK